MPPPRWSRLLVLLSLLAGALACAGERRCEPWTGPNLLANPGFEVGREGWSYREQSPHWGDFRIADEPVCSGARSVHLGLQHGAELPWRRAKVYGVVQELEPESFPEALGGWYRVEHWEKSESDTDLYLQVVVIVWGDPASGFPNHQIRYFLVGLQDFPFRLRNARMAFVAKGPPALGRWQRFEVPLREDFERLWGRVPRSFERISVLFEARWDNMPRGGSVRADVYYDDLYVEDATGTVEVSP